MDAKPELTAINTALAELAKDLSVLGIRLGGSRGLGLAQPDLDYDLVLYFDKDRPVDNAVVLRQLKDVTQDHVFTPSGRPIVRVGPTRLEFFYVELASLEKQVKDVHDGVLKLQSDRWFPHGKLSIEYLALLTNTKVLYDPRQRLAAIKRAVMPMTPAYQQQLLKFAIEGAEAALKNMKKAHARARALQPHHGAHIHVHVVHRGRDLRQERALPLQEQADILIRRGTEAVAEGLPRADVHRLPLRDEHRDAEDL